MSAKRNDPESLDRADAKTKLARLLETEDELEALLGATRRDARKLMEEAKRVAEERARDFETELAAQDDRLRTRIVEERDRAIDQIQREARAYAEHLDTLDSERIEALAQHVLDRLFGPSSGRGVR